MRLGHDSADVSSLCRAIADMKNLLNNERNDSRRQPGRRPNKKPTLPTYKRSPYSWLIVAVILVVAMMVLQQGLVTYTLRWDKFMDYLYEGGQIERVSIGDTEITGKFRERSEACPGGRRGCGVQGQLAAGQPGPRNSSMRPSTRSARRPWTIRSIAWRSNTRSSGSGCCGC